MRRPIANPILDVYGEFPTDVIINPYAFAPAASFSPLDISGCVLWLKADGDVYNTGTTQATDGQTVDRWMDASPNAKNGSAWATAPTFETNEVNGKPVVRFGGAGGFTLSAIGTNKTLFVVAKQTSAGGSYVGLVVTDGDAGSTSARMYSRINSGAWGTYTTTAENASTTPSNGTWYVFTCQADTNKAFYLNGASDGTYSNSGDNKTSGYIGHNNGVQYFTGDIAEIIAYDTALSTANREAVEDYLGAKYGITITH